MQSGVNLYTYSVILTESVQHALSITRIPINTFRLTRCRRSDEQYLNFYCSLTSFYQETPTSFLTLPRHDFDDYVQVYLITVLVYACVCVYIWVGGRAGGRVCVRGSVKPKVIAVPPPRKRSSIRRTKRDVEKFAADCFTSFETNIATLATVFDEMAVEHWPTVGWWGTILLRPAQNTNQRTPNKFECDRI